MAPETGRPSTTAIRLSINTQITLRATSRVPVRCGHYGLFGEPVGYTGS